MEFNDNTKVQCFYNVRFNIGSKTGCLKFAWGFSKFLLHNDDKPLLAQIIDILPFEENEVFNVNITALTPFPDSVFENEPDQGVEQPKGDTNE